MSHQSNITDTHRLEFLFSLNSSRSDALDFLWETLERGVSVKMSDVRVALDAFILSSKKVKPEPVVHAFTEDDLWLEILTRLSCLEDMCSTHMRAASNVLLRYESATEEERKLAGYTCPPDTPEDIRKSFDERMQEELNYYSTARVVELPKTKTSIKNKRFILVYGHLINITLTPDPFQTLEEAQAHFLSGGR